MKRLALAVLLLSISAFAQTNILANNGTFTGTVTAPNVGGTLWVGSAQGQYATIAACMNALPALAGTCFVGPNQANGTYLETFASSLAVTKSHSTIIFTVPYSVTLGNFQITQASTVTDFSIFSWAANGSLFGYTGNSCAFCIGDSAGNTQRDVFENIGISLIGAGTAAVGMDLPNVTGSNFRNIVVLGSGGATTQIGMNFRAVGGFFQGDNVVTQAPMFTLFNCIKFQGTGGNGSFSNTVIGPTCTNTVAGGAAYDFESGSNSNIIINADVASAPIAIAFNGTTNNNRVSLYNDANTLDVSAGASSFDNQVDATLVLPTVSDSGTNNSVTWLGNYKLDKSGNLTIAGTLNALIGVQVNGTATSGKYLKSDGTKFIPSTGSASGIGTPTVCTNQAVTGFTLNSDAAPTSTCTTITSAFTSGTFSPTAHNLLSASHGDTTAASVVRGDGLFGIGASPTWQRVAHPATTGGYFKWNATDMVASTGAAGGTGSCTNQVVTAENADASPTCTTVTSSYVDTSIAKTGTDINTSNQVTKVSGTLTSYNGTTLADLGIPIIAGRARQVSAVAAIGSTNLVATTVSSNALYAIQGEVDCDTSSAAATVTITAGWTDVGNTAQTSNSGTATCTALGANSRAQFYLTIEVKASTAITYSTSIANTPTYDLRLVAFQLSTN